MSFSVAEITAIDSNGVEVTQFEDSVEICLSVPKETDKDKACLAYIDDTNDWKCEDPCLREKESNGETLFCGETDHFTSFAILLDSSTSNSGCDSDDDNEIFVWLSIAFIGCSIVIIIISIAIIEIFYQNRARNLSLELDRRTHIAGQTK